jgi:hypothetical protein
MINDAEVLSFGELREALKMAFPDQTEQDRNLMMIVLWAMVKAGRS